MKEEDKLAVILLGTEGDGLAPETIADCDYTVMIPMSHGVRFVECCGRQCSSILAVGKEINGTDKTLDMLQLKNCL